MELYLTIDPSLNLLELLLFHLAMEFPVAKLVCQSNNMRVTNFEDVNQFVKREYRKGWNVGVL